MLDELFISMEVNPYFLLQRNSCCEYVGCKLFCLVLIVVCVASLVVCPVTFTHIHILSQCVSYWSCSSNNRQYAHEINNYLVLTCISFGYNHVQATVMA